MNTRIRTLVGVAAAAATLASAGAALSANAQPVPADGVSSAVVQQATKTPTAKLRLSPSSAALAKCFPKAHAHVNVALTTDAKGKDTFTILAEGLKPRTDFTVFLIEKAGAPFGAAEYIGDFTTNPHGNAHNTFKLIVQEAFSSTLVNGQRMRVDLNRIGTWFADPNDDDFCPSAPGTGGTTPFDGDNAAGVQAFNSANAAPLPLP
jgi:hypothetical protein